MAKSKPSKRPTARAAKPKPRGKAADSANPHLVTRNAHATETAEDYTETISELITLNGEARVVDLARRLGVSHVTVVRTVARLSDLGLVKSEPYRAIFLTAKGQAMANACRARHEVVLNFLLALGVPDEVAQVDAEGIEHHVSDRTLKAMTKFTTERRR